MIAPQKTVKQLLHAGLSHSPACYRAECTVWGNLGLVPGSYKLLDARNYLISCIRESLCDFLGHNHNITSKRKSKGFMKIMKPFDLFVIRANKRKLSLNIYYTFDISRCQ